MKTNSSLKIVLGSTIVAALSVTTPVHADQNPFTLKPLAHGYMLAEADQGSDDKMKDGNCSAEMQGSDDKSKDGSCSSEMKGEPDKPEGGSK